LSFPLLVSSPAAYNIEAGFVECGLHALFLDVVVEQLSAPKTADDDNGGQDDGVTRLHRMMDVAGRYGAMAQTFIAIVYFVVHVAREMGTDLNGTYLSAKRLIQKRKAALGLR